MSRAFLDLASGFGTEHSFSASPRFHFCLSQLSFRTPLFASMSSYSQQTSWKNNYLHQRQSDYKNVGKFDKLSGRETIFLN